MMKFWVSVFLFSSNVASAKETQRFEVQVDRKPVIEVSDVQSVKVAQAGAEWYLSVHLTKQGTKKFAVATKKNIGKIMDIVIHEQIRSSPTIRSEIKSGDVTVIANFTEEEAKSLAREFSLKAPTQK